jgi:broad specificity phosphatase PhoE
MTRYPLHHPTFPRHGGELILVRHGQSTANALGIAQGRSDWPLSEKGRLQARLTGERLARELGSVDAVYTSPLSRAAETAQLIAEPFGRTPVLVDDLVEADVGKLSGLTWEQFRAEYPAEVAAYEAANAEAPHPTNRERFLPGWEPNAQVVDRVWRAIEAIAERHPGQRVVVVAHGGVLNAFLTHLLEGDAHAIPWKYHSTNCAVSRIRLEADGLHVACVVDASHLRHHAPRTAVKDSPLLS